MACCLTAPSYYLNQCWLIFSKVQWHPLEGNCTKIAQPLITKIILKINNLTIHSNLPGDNEYCTSPLPPAVSELINLSMPFSNSVPISFKLLQHWLHLVFIYFILYLLLHLVFIMFYNNPVVSYLTLFFPRTQISVKWCNKFKSVFLNTNWIWTCKKFPFSSALWDLIIKSLAPGDVMINLKVHYLNKGYRLISLALLVKLLSGEWQVNHGSRNGLVPSGNKPLPEPMNVDPDLYRHMASQCPNELISWSNWFK